MSRFAITHQRSGTFSVTLPPSDASDRATLRHAGEAFGFLVPPGERMTGPELANRIRATYDNPKAEHVATVLERY